MPFQCIAPTKSETDLLHVQRRLDLRHILADVPFEVLKIDRLTYSSGHGCKRCDVDGTDMVGGLEGICFAETGDDGSRGLKRELSYRGRFRLSESVELGWRGRLGIGFGV